MSDDIAADLREAVGELRYSAQTNRHFAPTADHLDALADRWATIAAVLDAAVVLNDLLDDDANLATESWVDAVVALDDAVRAYREASAPSSPQGEHR